jgi:hypothetical protein
MTAQSAERQKLSRAAQTVNRECGLAVLIGGGSGELLGHVVILIIIKLACDVSVCAEINFHVVQF